MKKNIVFIFVVILSSFIFSCKKDNIENDNEKPTIEVIEPSFEATVKKDTLMRITAYFRDDIGLKSCEMTIGDIDGNVIPELEYSYTETYKKDDKNLVRQYTYGDNIGIPNTLSVSPIYLHFKAIDQNGNSSELAYKVLVE